MDHEDDHFFKEIEGLSTLISPPEDLSTNYYNQYCRLYLANFVLTSQMKELIRDKKDLEHRLFRLEDKHDDFDYSETQERNKRHRRTANEINRFHKCSISTCLKSYGSEGSLNQHIKLKHPELLGREEEESTPQSRCLKETPVPKQSLSHKQNINQNRESRKR